MEERFRPGSYFVNADDSLRETLRRKCVRCGFTMTYRNARIRYNIKTDAVEVGAIGLAEICSACGHVFYPNIRRQ